MGLGIAKSCSDTELVHSAFEAARLVLEKDPYLTEEKHKSLKAELEKTINEKSSTIN